MSLGAALNNQYTTWKTAELLIRITVACFCGAAIGFERHRRLKEAGIRTHLIVCATAALLMIVSKYAFADLIVGEMGTRGADSARIAAQVVSGISFLCAGVIIKVGENIRGLTTAAGIWMTAAIGLTIGAGLYIVALFTVLILILFQFVLHRISFGYECRTSSNIIIEVKESFPMDEVIQELLEETGGLWEILKVMYEKNKITYYLVIRSKNVISERCWQEFFEGHEGILRMEHSVGV